MRQVLFGLVVVATGAFAAPAFAHGGAYQPPPNPRGGGMGGPTTGDLDPGRGPVTGGNPGAAPTTDSGGSDGTGGALGPTGAPGSAPGSAPGTGQRPRRPGSGMTTVDFNSVDWARWWFANRLLLLDWRARVAERAPQAVTGGERESRSDDELWRAATQAALQKALKSRSGSVASAAAIALGKGGDPGEAPALVEALNDERQDERVREAAALGLGLLPPDEEGFGPQVREALETCLRNGRESDRLRAFCVYALGLREEEASVPVILAAAESGGATWDIPAAGVSALGLSGCDLTLTDLIDMLEGPRRRKRREAVRRTYAAQALARLGDAEALPALQKVALDSEDHARRAAVLALGALAPAEDKETQDVLLHLLRRSKDSATRGMAAISLGRVGGERGRSSLVYAYKKGDAVIRPFAAIGLGLLARHGDTADATRVLHHDLENRASPQLRAALCVAMSLARDPAAAPLLREIVQEERDPGLRAHAALALAMTDDSPKTAELLRELLVDTRDPTLQRECALALGIMGDREALEILGDLVLHGGSAYVQGSAAVSIGRIGGAESADALLEVLGDGASPSMARAMSAVGLGLLLDRSEGRRLAQLGADLNWYLFTPTVLELLTIH